MFSNKLFHLMWMLIFSFSCYSVDVSIAGFIMPEDGIGKVPVTILETLGDGVSANVIATDFRPPIKESLPFHTARAVSNPDTSPGKVCIFTEGICSLLGNNYKNVPKESLIKIAYSMFETDRIPKMWVKNINDRFDCVVVPDSYYVDVYKQSGVTVPIFVLPIPMMLKPYLNHPSHQFKAYPFVFGDASANKNPAILLEAFAQAFGNSPYYHLVLRAGNILKATRETIESIIQKYGLSNVTIETGHLLLDPYIEKLSSFDCYVNLSCGEGFSFIPREALALGVPVIITDNTASTTICKSGLVRPVKSVKKIRPQPWIYKPLFDDDFGDQFQCEIEDAKNALLDVYNNYATYLHKAFIGREWVKQYDCENPVLRKNYCTLVKPKEVVLSEENKIENETLFTTSVELYQKYLQIIGN